MSLNSPTDDELVEFVANIRLNGQEPLQCNKCGGEVNEGEQVLVRFHFDGADENWLITGRFCKECGPVMVAGPKPFAAEAIIEGSVGMTATPRTQAHFPVLLDPEVVTRT